MPAWLKSAILAAPAEAPRWLRYAYFMRFSILLWLFPLLLIGANSPSLARSLVSGIVTPKLLGQYLCSAFFLIADSFVALILARVVVLNGQERFGEEPPAAFVWLLANPRKQYEWIAPIASLLNSLGVFAYFFGNGRHEKVEIPQIAWGVGFGFLLAIAFWYSLNALYYLTYDPSQGGGRRSARTLLFPRSWMFRGKVLEEATEPRPIDWITRLFPVAGYRCPPHGNLHESHYFSMLAGCGFFALYLVLWPLTAPVTVLFWSYLSLILFVLGGATVAALVFAAKPGHAAHRRKLLELKFGLALPILGFAAALPWLYFHYDAQRFPILALVLILAISASWTLGGIAFYADRYRIPVLTLLITLTVIPRWQHWDNGKEAHYLSVSLRPKQAALPTPAEILNRKLGADASRPLIVVTATGGGIHSAAWTTAVLEQLETYFNQDNSLKSFHDHVLLISTVSGGSAGLYAYLRELNPQTSGGKPDWARMKQAARCSSLEAIGWGLIYYDLPKAFIPALPYLAPPSTGVDDLDMQPLGKDRTWALRRAMARNLDDPFCQLAPGSSGSIPLRDLIEARQRYQDSEHTLTLGNLSADAEGLPAFTMNTTTVEEGDRFLLANYQIPFHRHSSLTPPPAESFLDVYKDAQFWRDGQNQYVDLPLATAAQLSATFPYVSSAAGFPQYPNKVSEHFVDGGYYDNDGTGSAIEFLREAIEERAPGAPKVRILLIEIRNSPDEVPQNACCVAWKASSPQTDKPWNLVDQVVAPATAFYEAGHGSVTERNRDNLDLLVHAYADQLDLIDHIVIDDQENTSPDRCTSEEYKTDPLNWSLTPAQQCEVDQSAAQASNQQKFQEARNWFIAKAAATEPPTRKKTRKR